MKEIIDNFVTVVSKKYACFEGRASQGEFWRFFLVLFVVNLIFSFIPYVGAFLSGIWGLAMLIPMLAITTRRLHDTGKSGWLQLLYLVPLVGGLIVLILCIPAGNPADNKYGTANG